MEHNCQNESVISLGRLFYETGIITEGTKYLSEVRKATEDLWEKYAGYVTSGVKQDHATMLYHMVTILDGRMIWKFGIADKLPIAATICRTILARLESAVPEGQKVSPWKIAQHFKYFGPKF